MYFMNLVKKCRLCQIWLIVHPWIMQECLKMFNRNCCCYEFTGNMQIGLMGPRLLFWKKKKKKTLMFNKNCCCYKFTEKSRIFKIGPVGLHSYSAKKSKCLIRTVAVMSLLKTSRIFKIGPVGPNLYSAKKLKCLIETVAVMIKLKTF